MKKLLAAIALAMVPMVVGCATIARVTGQEQIVTYDERALLTAEYAFDTASSAIRAADSVGALTAERAAQIRPLYNRAYTELQRARALYDANRAAEAGDATQSATLAVATLLQALIEAGILQP